MNVGKCQCLEKYDKNIINLYLRNCCFDWDAPCDFFFLNFLTNLLSYFDWNAYFSLSMHPVGHRKIQISH